MRFPVSRLLLLVVLLFLFASSGYAQSEFLYLNRDYYPDQNAVSALSIAADGSLAEIAGSPFPTSGQGIRGGRRQGVVINGLFLFASNTCSSNVSAFTINPTTGALRLVQGSPFSTRGGSGCVSDGMSLAITPSGKFLMAGNTGDGTISVFNVLPSGQLTLVPGSPFQTAGEPLDMKVTNDNNFLVVASGMFGGIEVYRISSSGVLTAVSGSPFLRDRNRAPAALDMRCDGKIFVEGSIDFGKVIDVLNISETGQLSPIAGSPVIISYTGPCLGRLTFDERFLFANRIGFEPVFVFSVAPDGRPVLVPDAGANLVTDYNLSVITNHNSDNAYFGTFGVDFLIRTRIDPNGILIPVNNVPLTGSFGGVPSLAVFPAKVCGPAFNFCIQDESNGGVLKINNTIGSYQFTNCRGVTISGIGSILARGCSLTLQVNGPDRRVLAKIDTCAKTASASIQVLSSSTTFTLLDRNTANNTCLCASSSQ